MKQLTLGAPRARALRAWAPVFVWICVVLFIGTRPALFQRFQKFATPILKGPAAPPARSLPAPAPSKPSVSAPGDKAPSTGTKAAGSAAPAPSALERASSLWLRVVNKVRSVLARYLLNGASAEIIGHSAVYGVLGVLLRRGQIEYFGKASALNMILAGVLVAGIDEGLQNFVPSRTASVFDMVVDTSAVACGIVLYDAVRLTLAALRRWRHRTSEVR